LVSGSTDNVLALLPGHYTMVERLKMSGGPEPPAGTVMLMLLDGKTTPGWMQADARRLGWPDSLSVIPSLRIITSQGWMELDHLETRLAALALAAIVDFVEQRADGTDRHVAGEVLLPGRVRGMYRARPVPDERNLKPTAIRTGMDLWDGGFDGALSFYWTDWADFDRMRARARLLHEHERKLERTGQGLPLFFISSKDEREAAMVTQRLVSIDPISLMVHEVDGDLCVMVFGRQEGYLLLKADEDVREQAMLWWHDTKESSGAHALLVTDSPPTPDGMSPATIHAIFEGRIARD
jgi:hypothetical protein